VRGIGNMVLLTGLLANLRQRYPGARIAVAMPPSPLASSLIPSQLADDLLFFDASHGPHRALLRFAWRELRPHRFDLGLATFFTPTLLTSLALATAGCRYRIAYAESERRGFLNTITIVDAAGTELERHLRLLPPGESPIRRSAVVSADPECTDEARRILARKGLGGNLPLLGVHPGSDRINALKRWPLERFAAAIRQIERERIADTVVFLGPDETELHEQLEAQLGESSCVMSGAPLDLVTALIGECDAFLTNDSGLMHIAAAQGVPTVAIFGPTSEVKNAPGGAATVLTAVGVSCRPCYAQPPITCAYERRHCLERIAVNDVVAAVRARLEPLERNTTEATGGSTARIASGGSGRR